MKNSRKLDDRGFSLIEMLVVIAIIAVVTGIFTVGFSLISTRNVDQCAKKIQISLESCRTTTMGKLDAYLQFMVSDGKIAAVKWVDNDGSGYKSTTSVLAGDDVSVTYKFSDGTSCNLKDASLEVRFDRASGSLKSHVTASSKFLTEIIVTNKSGTKTLKVKIDKLTGRVTVE